MSFHLLHADVGLQVFALRRSSGLELISSMKLNGGEDIQSVLSVCSVLHAEIKFSEIKSPLYGNNKGYKRKAHMQAYDLFSFYWNSGFSENTFENFNFEIPVNMI